MDQVRREQCDQGGLEGPAGVGLLHAKGLNHAPETAPAALDVQR